MRKIISGGLWPWIAGTLILVGACDAQNAVVPVDDSETPPLPPNAAGKGGSGGKGVDDTPVVSAPKPPPTISGGTLLALNEGGSVVVADSDRDRLLIVDLTSSDVRQIPLAAGAEPGRLVEDAAGRVHVALRGTGELVTIDVNSASITAHRAVCHAPRGLAYDAAADNVLVACLEGTLVELPASGGDPTRTTTVATDLRDVAFIDGTLAVTRFRSAQVLFLDAQRQITKTVELAKDSAGFAPSVAWRAVPSSDGRLAIAHQRSFMGRIEVAGSSDPESSSSGTGGTGARINVGGFGGGGAAQAPEETAGAAGSDDFTLPIASGYGSPIEPCSSVVQSTFSFVSADGSVHSEAHLQNGVLPVDIATRDDLVAVAFAGTVGQSSVSIYSLANEHATASGCRGDDEGFILPNVVAVAFEPTTDRLVVQSREPSQLTVIDLETALQAQPSQTIPLGGESMADTGHDLFHTDAGGGIACASCHPEGTEDGRVWNFSDVGARRTQPLDVGLAGTAPFHWDGELPSFGDLMLRIFTERMAGPFESDPRAGALEAYVYSLPRRPAVRPATDAAALRGKAIFESSAVGCTTCHNGPNFSNNGFADVGKGVALQVPSLIAVSERAPYMHDGCASTLLERFDPSCGGAMHGDLSSLSQDDIGDLVAYLESL